MKKEYIKEIVRKDYAKVAKQESSCCGPVNSCCEGYNVAEGISQQIGYSKEEIGSVPEGANLGLGCGNPIALASLREGETVLDLGAGAGFDCFLAAQRVGKSGRVIGVDMTPEMVEKAKQNAIKGNIENVEFRLGDIENLPVSDNSVDVIISNCVINLSPDKGKVFSEAFRVLKPGGRLMVSDIVLLNELPDAIKNSPKAYVGCISGAMLRNKYINKIKDAGFEEVKIVGESAFSIDNIVNDPVGSVFRDNLDLSDEIVKKTMSSVVSIKVTGIK